jgi:ABC-2 type transport system permease protein
MNIHTNYVAFKTIVRKEIVRFLRIWPQTLLPSVITQTLYFTIFGKFIGSQLRDINGISYMSFIVPGLVMMSVINNSYSNVVSSFFGSKFQRNVEELIVSPTANWVMVFGYVTGGVLRGIIVGFLVFCVSIFFARPVIYNIGLITLFIVLTAIMFALGGFLNGVIAQKFDDVSIFPTFILTPLIYLGGVFYSIHSLPQVWQIISKVNPVLYMVNGFRYGFFGFSDVGLWMSLGILTAFIIILLGINLYLLRKGIGLKN